MAKEIAEEYASSLEDLTMNSKPLINMLTILAEENIEHAGVIVETVEKHLEKVEPEIKLPVLYLVDSIIKNVGGAYTQEFSQSIVSMFTKTFKVVDEKIRSQMFKLRETWHEVFPAMKLYQLDVKVNLIDHAWPIQAQPQPQAQPHQSNIHFNPNFLKKPGATATANVVAPPSTDDEEKMRKALAQKEQELLMLQRKKIELELEQTKRQLELAGKAQKGAPPVLQAPVEPAVPVPVAASVMTPSSVTNSAVPDVLAAIPVKQRLGPPVNKHTSTGGVARIAPVSSAMLASVRRDPRLARQQALPQTTIAANVFDIKPLERVPKVIKRKNVITIDVRTDNEPNLIGNGPRDPRSRRDPRLEKQSRTRDVENRVKRAEFREKIKAKMHGKYKKLEDDNLNKRKDNNERCDGENLRKIHNKDKPTIEKNVDTTEKIDANNFDIQSPSKSVNKSMEEIIPRFLVADPKKINKLPPIPKLNKQDDVKNAKNKKPDEPTASPIKKRKENTSRTDKKTNKKRDSSKESSDSSSSPEKKAKDMMKDGRSTKCKNKEQSMDLDTPDKSADNEVVTFKELKNYHKDKYMRRNKEKSESPEKISPEEVPENKTVVPGVQAEATNVPEIVENKDIDLRVLPGVVPDIVKAVSIAQKRPSTESLESKNVKKHKQDKFDKLFGNEDVDLRQLPQVEETNVTLVVSEEPMSLDDEKSVSSPEESSKQKDWTEIKENTTSPDPKNNPSQLDLVRAKLAEATKGKDRLNRQLGFNSLTGEKERRRTISSEDTDLRMNNVTETEPENDKESIKIIISQAEEQLKEGNINKEQFNTLMYQVMQLNERLKLKEAKQRESLEVSKRKLHKAHISDDETDAINHGKNDNTFGDIDERIVPTAFIPREPFVETPISNITRQNNVSSIPGAQDSDLRIPSSLNNDIAPNMVGPNMNMPMIIPPMFMGPQFPIWRGPQPRQEELNGPREGRPRGPIPPFFRGKFDNRGNRNFEPIMPMPPMPPPSFGMFQGQCPIEPYNRPNTPPPLGTQIRIPPTDFRLLEYIDRDSMKTIEIDKVPREIRFYGQTAVVMLEWDDPREIKFLPGSRRITFDNKDSVVLGFNEDYTTVEIDEQTFRIRFGAPTRELYINDIWFECLFDGPPCGIVIDGIPRIIHLEGPAPNVDIGNEKRTDLVAGKINLIIDAQYMCPIFLDAKPQKCNINNIFFTLRFVDSLRTVLINEVPFQVEFGGLPRPIFIGKSKHFIRFSVLPRNVRPGQMKIANMEGKPPVIPAKKASITPELRESMPMEVDVFNKPYDSQPPERMQSPDGDNSNPGLDMLASMMPTSMAQASQFSGYSLGVSNDNKIPGLDTPADEKPPAVPNRPLLGNMNVNDLFAKLVATGIVPTPTADTKEPIVEIKQDERPYDDTHKLPKHDRNVIKHVNLLRPETLRVKQPAIVAKLYGGMQCSGCGARFPPEHTVRYSQHLDWHFRQNRRERDSARRAHSRLWHYDLADWVQYEEVEDLEEREKSWFETVGAEGEGEAVAEPCEGEAPSVPAGGGAPRDQHCALCGDKFDQFYNEDKEEWHLRKAVSHLDGIYHPLCFEDLKLSQTKEESKPEADESIATDEPSVIIVEKEKAPMEAPIEIQDGDDDDKCESDNESVVEVLDSDILKENNQEPLEIEEEEGDEDDVVLKADPVEEVVVDDDADTDDETRAERGERDLLAQVDFAKVKVKLEPVDPDDEPIITAEEEAVIVTTETTSTTVTSSIDGNVQLDSRIIMTPAFPMSGIRINISTLPTVVTRPAPVEDQSLEDISVEDDLVPPGEEPELNFALKPACQGVQFRREPPVQRGTEVSGLCSIM